MSFQRLLLIASFLLLAACSKITAENYQKIKSGMSRDEVVAILGEPTQSEAGSLLGIEGETASWQNGGLVISAQFVNGKLLTHGKQQQ
ncbi:outer membrane protein assembly factor BamE domain-containing protein [Chitinilyticum litopenaei]|uniref:outer membrane protein assembly factor BamE domain-containing protein n=1 Tax=Chitinilyticum litopenaei TaxID=1121276 RepID=UPI000414C717|nr:outer membrane protein assembly factor BamE [Chitinilyticum litopenaei]